MKQSIDRILIVRLSAMGDVILALPAGAALREHLPHARIGWVVEQRWAELLCTLSNPRSGARSAARPIVDAVHLIDTKLWGKSPMSTLTWQQAAAALSDLRAPQYQVAVDFQGLLRSAAVAKLSQAPGILGFRNPRELAAGMFYSRAIIVAGKHVIEKNLSLVQALVGEKLQPASATFPCDQAAEEECESRLKELTGGRPFVLLNPGAGWGSKQWPPERYGAVGKALAKDGVLSLVNFGPGEDTLAKQVESASGGAAKPASSSITQLISLTRRASLFIGGDTGPLHLAAALKIPVVAIFGPTDPARNGPFGTRNVVLRSPESVTDHSRLARPEPGLLNVTADQVHAAARDLLELAHG